MPTATKKKPRKPEACSPKPDRRRRFIPDLKRYQSFRSSRNIYVPFDAPEDLRGEYVGKYSDPDAVVYSCCVALSRLFGFPMNLISEELKALIRKTVAEETPRLRCSSLRAVMEGRVPGFPKPTSHVPHKNHYARTALMLMDVMDTLICRYLSEQDAGLSLLDGGGVSDLGEEIDKEMSAVSTPMKFPTMAEQIAAKEKSGAPTGSAYSSAEENLERGPTLDDTGTLNPLIEEDDDALEDEETGPDNGSSVSQPEDEEETEDS